MNITKKSDKIKASVVEKIRKGYSFMGEKKKHSNMTTLMGAAFLMATSAIGPGFLTQTSTFTAQYKSIFALVIICTILLDVTTQLNIWSVIGVSGMRGQDIANKVLPGLGYFIAFMVALGGLAFNIGNVGGGALGLNVLFGIPTTVGTFIAGIIGILIFLSKDAKASMDKLTKYLGSIMIIVVLYVADQIQTSGRGCCEQYFPPRVMWVPLSFRSHASRMKLRQDISHSPVRTSS